MQSLQWYARRLRSMSPPEILWRVQGKVRDVKDRCVTARWQQPIRNGAEGPGNFAECGPALQGPCAVGAPPAGPEVGSWQNELVPRAETVCTNRLTVFDLVDHDFGCPMQWNVEPAAGRPTPMTASGRIDYRDHRETGDCKYAWEHNRHTHLVLLGRAYRLTGERRYATKVVEHLLSWIEQCPFGHGMNWRSPLELAIRMINWTWALDLIRPSDVIDSRASAWILASADQHIREIARKYSKFSSANNHLIGEAAGVYIASSWFTVLDHADRHAAEARAVLIREMQAQVLPDGAHAELATGYHLFVLEFFLYAALRGREVGQPFPAPYWSRLEKMFDYLGGLLEGGELPQFNDADDGYVLDLGGWDERPRRLLAIGAALFRRPDFKALSGGFSEPAFWTLGSAGRAAYDDTPTIPLKLQSKAFRDAGHYLLQHGELGDRRALSVTVDCAPLGYGTIAAHGHADALSLTLRSGGRDVLVDPGTYDYFTLPEWRNYFRSSAAHNVITVDDHDQSEMLGLFLWGRRAQSHCVEWRPEAHGGLFVGEQDGYSALDAAVRHRRRVTLNGADRVVEIEDTLTGRGAWHAAQYWHFAEHCSLESAGAAGFVVRWPEGRLRLLVDRTLEVTTLRGSSSPRGGWVSRGYHRKQAAPVVVGRRRVDGACTLRTRIEIEDV